MTTTKARPSKPAAFERPTVFKIGETYTDKNGVQLTILDIEVAVWPFGSLENSLTITPWAKYRYKLPNGRQGEESNSIKTILENGWS